MERKTKSLSCKIKDLDDSKGIVSFYYSQYGNVDSDGDITGDSTFTKTTKENFNRIKHLKNHNITQVPGVIKEFYSDSYGAGIVSQLILGTQTGKETYEEYKAGAITEHSYGYDTIKEQFDEEKKANNLLEVKLYEVSSLNFLGANPGTRVVGVKSEKELLSDLDKLLKLQKGDFKDEYLEQVEKQILLIIEHIKSLREQPSGTNEPPDTGQEPIDAVKYLQENLRILKWTKKD